MVTSRGEHWVAAANAHLEAGDSRLLPEGNALGEHLDEPEGQPGQGRSPYPEVGRTYFAVLYLFGTVERARGKRPPSRFCLRVGEACVPLPGRFRGQPMSERVGQTLGVRLWPRTLPDGTLDLKSPFGGFMPELKRPGIFPFSLRGRLVAVDREEGTLQVEIRPNPRGRLQEAFRVTLWASLSLLEDLPPVGQGVYVQGEYRPKSGRLVAQVARGQPLWDDPA